MITWKKMRTMVATLLCALALSAAEPGQRAPGFALMDSKGYGEYLKAAAH